MTTFDLCDICEGKTKGEESAELRVSSSRRNDLLHLHLRCIPEELKHLWVFQISESDKK